MKKIVVLSDLHLVPDGELSFGIDTHSRVAAAVARIATLHADAAAVVIAGDIADHGSPAAYARFAALRAQMPVPILATLGNHDDREAYLTLFPADQNDETGKADHVIDLPTHRVVILDTHLPGSPEGALSQTQLDWLTRCLDAAKDRAAAIILHHNPADLRLRTDAIRLRDASALTDILRRHGRVELMLSGHVHMPTAGSFHGIPFATLGGNHFAVFPTLLDCPVPVEFDRIFREGPAHYAVLLFDSAGVRVHFESYDDRHRVLPIEAFRKILLPPSGAGH